MTNICVSIIVPIYKAENTLDRCVKSICNQDYANLEIILVDDGSPDSCPQLCDYYASLDSRIQVLHKKNGGLSDARNAGVKCSKGQYISFVDSDDYIEPNYISSMLQLAVRNNSDLVICSFYDYAPNRDTIKLPDLVISGRDLFIEAVKKHKWQYVVAWNKLYERKFYLLNLFDVGRQHEDEFAFHKVLCASRCVSITSSLLYHYTYNQNSIMNSTYSKKNLDRIDAFLQRLLFVLDNNIGGVADDIINDIVEDFKTAYSNINLKSDFKAKKIISCQQRQLKRILIDGLWFKLSLKNRVKFAIFILSANLFMKIVIFRGYW